MSEMRLSDADVDQSSEDGVDERAKVESGGRLP